MAHDDIIPEAWEGPCSGGPLHGRDASSRYPQGFLLVDMPNRFCWLYEWREDRATFFVRDDQPWPLHDEGPDNRMRAAEQAEYDVVAAPWAGSELEQAEYDAAAAPWAGGER